MAQCQLYHNPRCSKSRQALSLLEKRGMDIDIIDYINNPPPINALTIIKAQLNTPFESMLRTNEIDYKAFIADNPNPTEQELLQALHDFPKILQRPIVIYNGKAVIGRPPELIEELF